MGAVKQQERVVEADNWQVGNGEVKKCSMKYSFVINFLSPGESERGEYFFLISLGISRTGVNSSAFPPVPPGRESSLT